VVKTTNGGLGNPLYSSAALTPSIPGILISKKTTSCSATRRSFSASTALEASPTISTPSTSSRRMRRRARAGASSSTMSARMLLKLHSRRDAVPQCLRRFPASLQHLPIEQREPAPQPWFRLQEGSQPPSHTCVRTSPEGAAGHSACRCPRNHPGTRVKDPCQDRHPG